MKQLLVIAGVGEVHPERMKVVIDSILTIKFVSDKFRTGLKPSLTRAACYAAIACLLIVLHCKKSIFRQATRNPLSSTYNRFQMAVL